ncbi:MULTISPECIES: hypothetical protein [Sorangium]|uniref:hypothetical protein n=1 Tax=Sorangium TaxID=39643 RepID=UPI003D9C1C16
MRAWGIGAAAAALLVGPAAAQEATKERAWSAELGVTHVVLGDLHPTGGWTPTASARRWWPASERARVSAGVSLAMFDFSSLHWLGMLAGPEAGLDYRLSESWSADLALAVDFGRVPICNNWDLCVRFWGFFPRARVGLTYEASPGVSTSLGLGVRYVNSMAWEGLSWEPVASARFGW